MRHPLCFRWSKTDWRRETRRHPKDSASLDQWLTPAPVYLIPGWSGHIPVAQRGQPTESTSGMQGLLIPWRRTHGRFCVKYYYSIPMLPQCTRSAASEHPLNRISLWSPIQARSIHSSEPCFRVEWRGSSHSSSQKPVHVNINLSAPIKFTGTRRWRIRSRFSSAKDN